MLESSPQLSPWRVLHITNKLTKFPAYNKHSDQKPNSGFWLIYKFTNNVSSFVKEVQDSSFLVSFEIGQKNHFLCWRMTDSNWFCKIAICQTLRKVKKREKDYGYKNPAKQTSNIQLSLKSVRVFFFV